MPRPTRKAFSLGAAALVLYLVGANAQAGWLYVIAAAFVGVVAAGMIAPPMLLRRISATRFVPPVASVGDQVPVSVELLNGSRGRRGPFAGKDLILGQKTFVIEALDGGERSIISLASEADRRGFFERAELKLETAAPFGIAKASRILMLNSPIIIHPQWAALATFPLLEAASTPNEALHERPRRGGGMEFYGLREYRPGDSIRSIHWRSSAHSNNLLVKEYEEHIGSRMSIFLDGSVWGPEPFTSFETAISCAASLVMYGLDAGHPVQLFCPEEGGPAHLFEPGKGEALDWMARLQPDDGMTLDALVESAASEIFRHSTNVIIFPTDGRALERVPRAVTLLQDMGTRVIAVAISARSFARDERVQTEAEEMGLAERLSGMRVAVYLVEGEKELAECLREPLPS